jgi:hypothetical protein
MHTDTPDGRKEMLSDPVPARIPHDEPAQAPLPAPPVSDHDAPAT